MAEMGTSGMSISPFRLGDATGLTAIIPMAPGTLAMRVSVLTSSAATNAFGPILPAGFLTYTDFMPSANAL
jgi:hypothetical protein